MFRKHHYLTGEFNKAAKMYLIYWGDTLVAMNSVLPMPSGNGKDLFRSHRLVVLPDFQGLGIGTKINDFFGKYYQSIGAKYFMRSTHTRLIRHMRADHKWRETSSSGKHTADNKNFGSWKGDSKRVASSFEYMGEDYKIKPDFNLIVRDSDVPPTREELLALKDKYYLTVYTGRTKVYNDTELLCKDLGIKLELLYMSKLGNESERSVKNGRSRESIRKQN